MSEIVHKAIISDIREKLIIAQISRGEACGSCALKEACGQTTNTHQVAIESDNTDQYSIGQQIEVIISQSQAYYAAFWGYLLPLVLILFVLFTTYTLSKSEELAAIVSLGILVIYYVLLWIFRSYFQRKLQIRIR